MHMLSSGRYGMSYHREQYGKIAKSITGFKSRSRLKCGWTGWKVRIRRCRRPVNLLTALPETLFGRAFC